MFLASIMCFTTPSKNEYNLSKSTEFLFFFCFPYACFIMTSTLIKLWLGFSLCFLPCHLLPLFKCVFIHLIIHMIDNFISKCFAMFDFTMFCNNWFHHSIEIWLCRFQNWSSIWRRYWSFSLLQVLLATMWSKKNYYAKKVLEKRISIFLKNFYFFHFSGTPSTFQIFFHHF